MANDSEAYAGPIVTLIEARAAGLKRYFTGKPCPKGHITERYVSAMRCCSCVVGSLWKKEHPQEVARNKRLRRQNNLEDTLAKERACGAIWRAANPERVLVYRRNHYERNKSVILSAQKAWAALNKNVISQRQRQKYEKNREVYLAKNKEWRLANPQIVSALNRKKYEANREAYMATSREWAKKNPDKIRAIQSVAQRNRRARLRASGGRHTTADIAWLLVIQKRKCAHTWCKASIKDGYHVDHIMPLARGGTNDRKNLQLLCQPCNLRKSAKHPIDFAQRHGILL